MPNGSHRQANIRLATTESQRKTRRPAKNARSPFGIMAVLPASWPRSPAKYLKKGSPVYIEAASVRAWQDKKVRSAIRRRSYNEMQMPAVAERLVVRRRSRIRWQHALVGAVGWRHVRACQRAELRRHADDDIPFCRIFNFRKDRKPGIPVDSAFFVSGLIPA